MNYERSFLDKIISKICPLIPIYEVTDLRYIKKCSKILANIISNEYKPDIVIGIANGGLYPAFEVSRHLKCKMDSMKILHYRHTVPRFDGMPGIVKITRKLMMNTKPILVKDIDTKNIKGKKILLVDDETSYGDTLEFAKKVLKRKKPKTIKTATIFRHENYKADFFVIEAFNKCVINPWRKPSPYYETYLKKMSEIDLL